MTWFKLDDKSAFHKKVADAGNEAWGALCRAGAWSADHLTDGRVPWSVALAIAPRPVWDRLFTVKLCDAVDSVELLIHDYLDWNPSKEEVEKVREARSSAGKSGGKQRASKTRIKTEANIKQEPSNGLNKNEAKFNPVPVPIENPPTPFGESIRETARRAFGEGIRTVIPGQPFVVLDAEADVLVRVIRDDPELAGRRSEGLASVIRKDAADYARERGADSKYERGFSPTKWAEWRRTRGATTPQSGKDKSDKRTDDVQLQELKKAGVL